MAMAHPRAVSNARDTVVYLLGKKDRVAAGLGLNTTRVADAGVGAAGRIARIMVRSHQPGVLEVGRRICR
jgi:hypothetical protein